MDQNNIRQIFREQHMTTKQDLIDWIDNAKNQISKEAQTDFRRSAAFYHAYLKLLDDFKLTVRRTVLFEKLEDNWCYVILINEDSARVELAHMHDIKLTADGKAKGMSDQMFSLVRVQTKLLSVEEFANSYGTTPGTVRQWIRRGKIRNAKKVGNEWRIPYLARLPERSGYEPALYTWNRCLDNVPEEFSFLNRYQSVALERDEKNKKVYHIKCESENGPPLEELYDEQTREKLELFLIANPDVHFIGSRIAGFYAVIVEKDQVI